MDNRAQHELAQRPATLRFSVTHGGLGAAHTALIDDGNELIGRRTAGRMKNTEWLQPKPAKPASPAKGSRGELLERAEATLAKLLNRSKRRKGVGRG